MARNGLQEGCITRWENLQPSVRPRSEGYRLLDLYLPAEGWFMNGVMLTNAQLYFAIGLPIFAINDLCSHALLLR